MWPITNTTLWVVMIGLAGAAQTWAGQSPASSQPAGNPANDEFLRIVDEYLNTWDQFASGRNELVADLRAGNERFHESLTKLLLATDSRAPSRLVFYTVVKVAGNIPAESALGKAAIGMVGDDFPLTTFEGKKHLFSADLYFWWEQHKQQFEPYPLFEEWLTRDFAQQTVLPMYRQLQQQDQEQKR